MKRNGYVHKNIQSIYRSFSVDHEISATTTTPTTPTTKGTKKCAKQKTICLCVRLHLSKWTQYLDILLCVDVDIWFQLTLMLWTHIIIIKGIRLPSTKLLLVWIWLYIQLRICFYCIINWELPALSSRFNWFVSENKTRDI